LERRLRSRAKPKTLTTLNVAPWTRITATAPPSATNMPTAHNCPRAAAATIRHTKALAVTQANNRRSENWGASIILDCGTSGRDYKSSTPVGNVALAPVFFAVLRFGTVFAGGRRTLPVRLGGGTMTTSLAAAPLGSRFPPD
jgi:hypothetical protein